MSNLKEYVVVTDRPAEFMIWAKVHWETYERLKVGASESEKEIMTCRAVTTFNADQSLTEDKELEQLKAENSKMSAALTKIEGIARRFGNTGTNPEKDIELIEKLATEAPKTT